MQLPSEHKIGDVIGQTSDFEQSFSVAAHLPLGHLKGTASSQGDKTLHKAGSPTHSLSPHKYGVNDGHLTVGLQSFGDFLQIPSAHLNGELTGQPFLDEHSLQESLQDPSGQVTLLLSQPIYTLHSFLVFTHDPSGHKKS